MTYTDYSIFMKKIEQFNLVPVRIGPEFYEDIIIDLGGLIFIFDKETGRIL